MKARQALKADAKEMLQGRWKDSVLMCLIPTLVAIAIGLFISLFVILPLYRSGIDFNSADAANRDSGGSSSSSILSGLFSSLFGAGISWTYLDIFRGKRDKIEPFKDAFRAFAGPFLLGVICIFLLTMIFTTLWTLLFIIPGIIKALAYSQAFFIYYDTYEKTGTRPGFLACITASRHLMNGYKAKYFVLQLSFIGWHILAMLSLGIGYLWLTPYIRATEAVFYDSLPKTAMA